jgi:UDP-N-acetylmuramate--alanine ligase
LEFINHVPDDGAIFLCADDDMAYSLHNEAQGPTISYGFSKNADLQACDFQQKGLQSHFRLVNKIEKSEHRIILNLPGKHNVSNAIAAYGVARQLGIKYESIFKAFVGFQGIGRRFQMYGEFETSVGRVLLIDDYGHHPREIEVTLDAIRLVWPNRRLVMAYQPHRYTRTYDLMNEFVSVLSKPDVLLLLDVYSAGEAPIEGADGLSLCSAIKQQGILVPIFVPKCEELPCIVHDVIKDGDILLMQGAGDIGSLAAQMAANKLEW